jgi:hypothetical protein
MDFDDGVRLPGCQLRPSPAPSLPPHRHWRFPSADTRGAHACKRSNRAAAARLAKPPYLPPVRFVQTVFDKESVQVTLQNAVEEILKDQPYDHTKVCAAQAAALVLRENWAMWRSAWLCICMHGGGRARLPAL